MEPEQLRAKFDAKFKLWSERLLDLSGRNRLLNFRPTKVSTVDITTPGPQVLFDQLVNVEKSLTFPFIDIGSFLQMADEDGDGTSAGQRYPVRPGDPISTRSAFSGAGWCARMVDGLARRSIRTSDPVKGAAEARASSPSGAAFPDGRG